MTAKEHRHLVVDTMTEEEAGTALRTLAEASGDPVAWMLNHAPIDDEPETDHCASAAPSRPLDDVKAEFGIR